MIHDYIPHEEVPSSANNHPPKETSIHTPSDDKASEAVRTTFTELLPVANADAAKAKLEKYARQEATSQASGWLSSLKLKLQNFFGMAPSAEVRVQVNRGLLGSLVRGSPDSLDAKRSTLISYVKNYYKEINKTQPTPERAQFIKELSTSGEIALRLEQLENKTTNSSEFEALVQHINHSIEQLQPGEKLLLPSGYFSSEKDFQDGLVEIVKKDDNTCDLRYISLEGSLAAHVPGMTVHDKDKYVPYLEFKGFSTARLQELMPALVEAQMPHKFKIDFTEALIHGFTPPKVFSPLDILSIEAKPTLPEFSKEHAVGMRDSTKGRTMLAYLKINQTSEIYKQEKLQLELSTFHEIYQNSQDLLDASPQLRNECYDAGRHLVKRLDKELTRIDKELKVVQAAKQDPISAKQGSELKKQRLFFEKELDKTANALLNLHQKQLEESKVNKNIENWKIQDNLTSGVVTLPTPTSLGELTNVAQASSSKTEAPSKIDAHPLFEKLNFDPANFGADLHAKLDLCQELYTEGNYPALRSAVQAMVHQLPVPTGQNRDFWSTLGNSPATLQPLQDDLFRLSQLNFDLQRIENSTRVSTESVLTAAKLMVIHDRLAILKDIPDDGTLASKKEASMKRYYLNSQVYHLIGINAHLTLENSKQAKEAQEILNYFDNGQKTRELISGINEPKFQGFWRNIVLGNISYKDHFPSSIDRNITPAQFEKQVWECTGSAALTPSWDQQRQMIVFTDTLLVQYSNIDDKKNREKLNQETKCITKNGKTVRPLTTLAYRMDPPTKTTTTPRPVALFSDVPLKSKSDGMTGLANSLKAEHSSDLNFNVRDYYSNCIGRNTTQQKIMQSDGSPEEKDLQCLGVEDDVTRVENALALFEKRPELLRNPENLHLFKAYVFGYGALWQKLDKQPHVADEFVNFCRRQYVLADTQNNLQEALIFLDLEVHFREFVEQFPLEDKSVVTRFSTDAEALEKYNVLLNRAGNTQDKSAILKAKLLFEAKLLKEQRIDHLDPIEFIADYLNMKQTNPGKSGLTYNSNMELEQLIARMAPQVENLLKNDQEVRRLFTQIGIDPKEVANQPIKSNPPKYSIGNYTLDISKGYVFKDGVSRAYMPEDAPVQKILKEMGIDKPEIDCKVEIFLDKASGKEILFYTPIERPDLRIIQKEGEPSILQRKIKDSWYEFTQNLSVRPSEIDLLLSQGATNPVAAILHERHAWINVKDPGQIQLSNHQGDLEYRIKLVKPKLGVIESALTSAEEKNAKWTIGSVTRLKDGLQLMDPWKTDSQILGQIPSIETKEHIYAWGKGGKIKEITYPRLISPNGEPLTYTVDYSEKVPKLQSKQFKGFEIPLQKPLMASRNNGKEEVLDFRAMETDLLPVSFEGYQLLHHKSGSSKILIPIKIFESSYTSKSWFNRAKFNFSSDNVTPQRYVELDIDLNQRSLNASSKEAYAMAAYVFLAHKNYDAAVEYLKKSETSITLDDSHQQIIEWMKEWPDTSIEATAFKLKLYAMEEERTGKVKNADLQASEKLKMSTAIQQLADQYTKEKDSLPTELRLTAEELDLLSKNLTEINEQVKQSENQQIETQELKRLVDKRPKVSEDDAKSLISYIILENKLSDEPTFKPNSKRPLHDSELVDNFKALYLKIHQLSSNDPNYLNLRQRILFANPQNENAITAHSLLTALVQAKESGEHVQFIWPIGDDPKQIDTLRQQAKSTLDKKFLFNTKNSPFGAASVVLLTTLDNFTPSQALETENKIGINEIAAQINTDLAQTTTTTTTTIQKKIHKSELQTLQEEKEAIDRKIVKNNPKTALAFSNTSAENIFSPNLTTPLFFMSETAPLKCTKADCGFFTENSTENKALANLYKELQTDTEAYIEKNSGEKAAKTYTFKSKDAISDLKRKLEEERVRLLEGSRSIDQGNREIGLREAEERLVNFLQRQRRGSAKSILTPGMSKVPKTLIGLYSKGNIDPDSIERKYGIKVSKDECEALEELIFIYISKSIAFKALEELNGKVKTLPDDPSKIASEVVNDIQSRLNTTRYFDPATHPLAKELLTVEFENGYCLRQEQVETIEAFFTDSKKGVVKQLDMGAGKSSVLLPSLLNRFADGEHLAIGLLPDALIEIVGKDLDESCLKHFGKKFYRLEFNRTSDTSEKALLEIYNKLGNAIYNREPVIMTKNDQLSMRNKFVENEKILLEGNLSPQKQEALLKEQKLLADILSLIKSRSRVITDEVDVVFNVRQELNFAIGQTPISERKCTLGVDLYSKMLAWGSGNSLQLKDFANRLLTNQLAGATPEARDMAREQLAREYANTYITQIDPKSIGGAEHKQLMIKFLLKQALTDQEKIDLRLNKESIPEFMLKLKDKRPELFNEICYLRQFIGDGGALSGTLQGSDNVNYGRSVDGISTIPYKASNTPTNAEFGDSFERIAYSCQNYLQTGITQQQLNLYLQEVSTSIKRDIENHLLDGQIIQISDTDSYKKFKNLYPDIDLQKALTNPIEREKLRSFLNRNPEAKLEYLKSHVLPQYQMANEQIRANGNDCAEMFGEVNGFSGAPAGLYSYPDALDISNALNIGTNGKSIYFLLAAEAAGDLSIVETTAKSENPLESLIPNVTNFQSKYQVLIDTGAVMKGVDNQNVSNYLAGQGKPVAYVDDQGVKRLLEKGKSSASPTITQLGYRNDVSSTERITYYDQAHTTGTDIVQAPKARALVTIGEDLTIEKFFQGIWRMRQLGKGQQVDLAITDDVKKLIIVNRIDKDSTAPITVKEILLFCARNQMEIQAENCLRKEKDAITKKVPQTALQELINLRKDPKNNAAASDLFSHCQSLWIDPVKDELSSLAGVQNKEDTPVALENLTTKLVGDPDGIYQQMTKGLPPMPNIKKAIADTQNREQLDANKMPEKTQHISSSTQNSEMVTQQQQQQQQHTQTQMMQQANVSKGVGTANTEWKNWAKDQNTKVGVQTISLALPVAIENTWGKQDARLAQFNDIFDEKILLSPNFRNNLYHKDPDTGEMQLLPNRNRVAQVVMIQDESLGASEWTLGIIDLEDYQKIVAKKVISSGYGKNMAVYDLRPSQTKCVQSTAKNNLDPWDDNTPDIGKCRTLLVQAKIFAGEIHFQDKKEQKALTEWYNELSTDNKIRLRTLVESQLVDQRDRESYPASFLGKLLMETSSP